MPEFQKGAPKGTLAALSTGLGMKQNKTHENKRKCIKFRARCDNRWIVS
jgi:hypothetical protein